MSSSDAQPENRDGDNREIESLRAKVREFQQIIDALPIYLFYKDDNNKIIDLNVTAAESIGKPIEEIRGRQTEEFFPEADAAKFLKDDREVIASGRPTLSSGSSSGVSALTLPIRKSAYLKKPSRARFKMMPMARKGWLPHRAMARATMWFIATENSSSGRFRTSHQA